MVRTLRILVVDDSAFARRMLRRILEPAGHTVIEAETGPGALEQYSLHPPDLVFLDQVMTEMSGLELLGKFKELDPKARIFLATADIQTSTTQEAMRLGALGVLTKPFDGARVLESVQAASTEKH